MSDDLTLLMYDVQAQLIEMKEELKRMQKDNNELRNQIAVTNLMKTVDDHAKLYEIVGAMQVNFNALSTKVSKSDQRLSKINETLRKQNTTLNKLNETTETLKTKEKSMVDDQAKLSRNFEAIQEKVTTLSASVSNKDGILSAINETLKKQSDALERQNNDIQVREMNIKTIEKETIILLGGWDGSKMVDSLLVLETNGENDGDWKELNIKLPYAIRLHGAQFLNNYLYIFGGENEIDGVSNLTYKLAKNHKGLIKNLQWGKLTNMNERRSGISNSSVILDGRIWIIGGWNEEEDELKSVEMYDPSKNRWSYMKEMNQRRALAAAAAVSGKIFCFGGSDGYDILKSAESYDPSSDVWTLISDMPAPNATCGVVVMDGHLIAIGGKAGVDDNFLNSVWVLDTTDTSGEWISKETCLSRPLCQFSIARIDDKIFVCGGIYIDQKDSILKSTCDVEIFDGEA